MTSSQALLSLLAHAERERNCAMSDAKRVELEHRAAQRQADQLLAYRSDYELRWSRSFGDGGGIAIVQESIFCPFPRLMKPNRRRTPA